MTATTTHGPPGLPPPHYQCITTAKVFAICSVASEAQPTMLQVSSTAALALQQLTAVDTVTLL